MDKVVSITVSNVTAASGTALWTNQGWYTLNTISESEKFDINGCTTEGYVEYNPAATFDDGTCMVEGESMYIPASTEPEAIERNILSEGITTSGSALRVAVKSEGPHKVDVLTVNGKNIASKRGSGKQHYTFSGLELSNVYLVRLEAGRNVFTRRVMLIDKFY